MQWRDATLISAVPIVFISAMFSWWGLITVLLIKKWFLRWGGVEAANKVI